MGILGKKRATEISDPTNGGEEIISMSQPLNIEVTLEGVSDLLFHRWNVEEVDAKANAAKGSKAKKSDNVESYVYRNEDGFLCIPGEYLRQAVIHSAKFNQDPRSPRKSAMDIFKAGVVSLTPYASLGVKEWDYEHRCRVTIQRNGITRTRPAMKAGWQAKFQFGIILPEYIGEHFFLQVLQNAGRLIGLADFRPTYGRFCIKNFEVLKEAA